MIKILTAVVLFVSTQLCYGLTPSFECNPKEVFSNVDHGDRAVITRLPVGWRGFSYHSNQQIRDLSLATQKKSYKTTLDAPALSKMLGVNLDAFSWIHSADQYCDYWIAHSRQ